MRQFLRRALQRTDKLTPGQIQDTLTLSSNEIDRLETVMDSLIRGILVCDIAHKLILANKAARRLLSIVSYEQSVETVWSLITDGKLADFLAETLLSAGKAEEKEFDVESNGIHRLLSVSIMNLVQDKQVSGSLILIDDITERRSREAKMRRVENLASLTTLAAGIAHEIKNPLGALSIHVQLIQKAMKAQEKLCLDNRRTDGSECEPGRYFTIIDKYLNVVNEEIDRLNAIVIDFLFAVRPINADFRRGSINDFLSDLAEFVADELKEANVDCILNLAENLPMLDFDTGLMKQAFLNLVKNASGAMPDGGTLTISTEETDGEVHITIADTGSGITDENFPKIFEPYFTTKENGTGLGLTVVFKVIKEHQGEISVKSREGEGTTFTITLPAPKIAQKLITYDAV